MSLKIVQLNADTTFLLTFSPSSNNDRRSSRAFTILTDPWLQGHSSILHPAFQISHHTTTPAIQSLADLVKQPDLILISQDKPDHCHRETLCSLPKDARIPVLATPASAKKIRSWRHFEAEDVKAMLPYDAQKVETILRIPISGNSESAAGGEITITNIPTKRDITGLHNAIGISYHPASAEKPVSIIYTPHGVVTETLEPYIHNHLEPSNAFPITALFHCMNTEENPKIMGGLVAHGAPGGVEIAKKLQALHWIGTHDEFKNNQGFATAWIKSTPYEVEDVEVMLEEAGCDTQAHRLAVGGSMTIEADGSVLEVERDSHTTTGAVNGTNGIPAQPG